MYAVKQNLNRPKIKLKCNFFCRIIKQIERNGSNENYNIADISAFYNLREDFWGKISE